MHASRLATLLAVGCLAAVPGTAGAVLITFDPLGVAPGDLFSTDIVISELAGEIVSAYDLDILYDSAVLRATGVTFSGALGDPVLFEVFEGFTLAPGLVDLAQLSFLTDLELLDLQGGSTVVVASILFEALGPRSTSLGFVFDSVNDIKGMNAQILPVSPVSGSVDVGPAVPVPEPSALWLGLIALGALAAMRSTPRRPTPED